MFLQNMYNSKNFKISQIKQKIIYLKTTNAFAVPIIKTYLLTVS
jgi:hypothetical protein